MRGVVLNELDLLNKALKEGEIDKKSPFVILRILAKYYLGQGVDKNDIIYKLNDFMNDNYDGYRQNKWLDKLKGLVSTVSKYNNFELINVDEVHITEEEWEIITILNDKQLEKLAFIMLVYQKINAIKNPKSNGWINQNISDIFAEANVKARGDEQKIFLHRLYQLQYIKQKITCDSTSIQVNFVHNNSENKIKIDNFNNIISYYYEFRDNYKYIICDLCKKRVRVRGVKDNSRKYCDSCAKETQRELDRENKRRKRSLSSKQNNA